MVMIRDFIEDYFSDMESDVTNDTLFPFIEYKNDKEALKWLNRDIQDKTNRQKSRLQRIRQIEAKALERLRDPNRFKEIKEYFE